MTFEYDVCVVGGAGHIGLPLAVLFASKGLKVAIQDINADSIRTVLKGEMPFIEYECQSLLKDVLKNGNLFATTNTNVVALAEHIIITIGTPIDEFHNPKMDLVSKCLDTLPINNNQIVILRSTIFPGTTNFISKHLNNKGLCPNIAFCPERIAQGYAIKEMQQLPQIVSGITPSCEDRAAKLFSKIAPSIVRMNVMEAEFAKLFANAYRYIQFAATNQFYEMVTEAGLDYGRVLEGVKQDYPRLKDLPGPGFAAGACLYKDTLQLAAYADGQFGLGLAAIQVNEGLPSFIVRQLEKEYNEYGYELSTKTVGLLGMAFKANIDDTRTSLSYKLKKLMKMKAKKVLSHDPLVKDPDLSPLETVLDESDILIVCVPHSAYKGLDFKGKHVVNIWEGK